MAKGKKGTGREKKSLIEDKKSMEKTGADIMNVGMKAEVVEVEKVTIESIKTSLFKLYDLELKEHLMLQLRVGSQRHQAGAEQLKADLKKEEIAKLGEFNKLLNQLK